jgi:hypothetical protein
VVEGASLESLYMGNCIVGSNPILSAIKAEANASAFFVLETHRKLAFVSAEKIKKCSLAKLSFYRPGTPKRDHRS